MAEAAMWRLGDVAFCYLSVRGVVRATQVLVVTSNFCQAVVAAPSSCAVSHLGDWVQNGELAVQRIYRCACAQGDDEIALVFHSLDPCALLATPLPGALRFVTSDGTPAEFAGSTVAALFHGAAEGQPDRIQTVKCVSETVACYDAVSLATGAELFHNSSVILIPDFLTKEECRMLMEAADSHFEDICNGSFDDVDNLGKPAWLALADSPSLQRFCVSKFSSQVEAFSSEIIRDRILPFIEQQLPEVAKTVFGQSSGLKEIPLLFSPGEPAVNTYSEGGDFKIHSDKLAVTVNVLLSEPEAFVGGGTAFWSQDSPAVGRPESVLLKPRQGTGVVFNGSVEHSGRMVEHGLRHLYVASFSRADRQVAQGDRAA
eukprot:CAMPEP_0204526846 /NCGR_PEP_ID=MMETSP0661-20131031/8660_1 /ASSEMBLY_ACC=CAM_ASM_000606 /TAXON_ID=109239 /ORGANISM="Alexandrium margalefi, Strain AMGDE01CS-322" /LENGTH=371 /DNA_ID=CAMNT_0051532709 /DNA_START=59 /DNA_END=1174 /DNA_ORIENTATION=+